MSIEILLQASELKHNAVEFDKVREQDFIPAIEKAIAIAKNTIEEIKSNKEEPNFENVIEAMELNGQELDKVLGIFYNLYSAEASDGLQQLAPQVSSLTSNFSSDVSLDEDLFAKVKQVYDKKDSLSLTDEQKMLLDNSYKAFVRNGALLQGEAREELRKIDEELAGLSPKFSENVLKETNSFELIIDNKSDLSGLPESAIEAARELAEEKGVKKKEAWVINLDAPSFVPFLKFSDKRELREKVWKAYSSRCVTGANENQSVVARIVVLRHKRAKLLGYENHASYVLEERMAKSPEAVFNFLEDLKGPSREAAVKDLQEVKDFAAKECAFTQELMPWDFAYYSNKLKKAKYDFDPEELRPYFPVDKCIKGAFDLAERLFSIRFEKNENLPTYNEDVVCYEVYEKDSDTFVGLFYADFFPRPSKRGGAWMTSYKSQGWNGDKLERPHVSIVCNFTKATKDKPSLLSFNELETLFHEFGHSLHGLLSQCKYKSLAGTNVLWDFVELPSQFMENWLLEKEVLDLFAGHYETGESVPAEMIEKLQKSSRFQAGYQSLRQLNFCFMDMKWHGQYLDKIDDVVAFEKEATADTNLFPYVEGTCNSTGFSHIFAGGYSAGYYSYKWAEVLDADAFEHFKKNGLFNEEVAKSFKENILEKGGSLEPNQLYKNFKGSEPDPKALLRRDGLL